MFARRVILVIPVLICLLLILPGCASPGVMCNLKDRYELDTKIPDSGMVLLAWDHDVSKCSQGQAGCTTCFHDNCRMHLMRDVPWSDVCGLANLGHEFEHGLGKRHEAD